MARCEAWQGLLHIALANLNASEALLLLVRAEAAQAANLLEGQEADQLDCLVADAAAVADVADKLVESVHAEARLPFHHDGNLDGTGPRLSCIAVPSPPRARWGVESPLGSPRLFDISGKEDMHTDGNRTPSAYGEGTGWLSFPSGHGQAGGEVEVIIPPRSVGEAAGEENASGEGPPLPLDDRGVPQFPKVPEADGGEAGISVGSLPRHPGPEVVEAPWLGCKTQVIVGGAAIQMNTLPRPPEVADGGLAQGGKGTALASELPRPPEAAGGHGVADGDGLLAAGLPRPPEADVTLPEGRSAHLMAEAASALVQYVNNPAVRAALLRAQATSQLA